MVEFQIIDSDYTYDKQGAPVLRFYGRDVDGASVCCFVPGFKPYFYVKTNNVERLASEFPQIVKVEETRRFPPVGYYDEPVLMYKVTLSDPKEVPEIRDDIAEFAEVFETDILFRNRFMIDNALGGMSWVRVEETPCEDIDTGTVLCDRKCIGQVTPVEKTTNAPLRYLSFDIECVTEKGMPEAQTAPIVMISLYFTPEYNNQASLVLVAKPARGDGIEGCEDEVTLLKRFFEIVRDYDPDVIFGYNSNSFDFPYIVDRVKALDAGIKTNLGRDNKPVYYKRIANNTRVTVTGRIIADVLPLLRKEFSLKQYTLKNTAKELLGLEKHDVKVENMYEHWQDEELLPKFIEYCRNDSYLARELMMRYRLLDKYIALAKVSGSLLQDILDSGQTAMVENLLLREYLLHNRVMPTKPGEELSKKRYRVGEELKGGEVLEPAHGLLENIIILDYRSLYPSIMMAHNLCYTTELLDDAPKCDDVIVTPSGGRFVSRKVQRGIMPLVLERLLKQRVEIKKQMKTARDEELHVLDATQTALKILLNSFYGYSGYARARLYSLTLANSVTSYGRENIFRTKELIETQLQNIILTDRKEVLIASDDMECSGAHVTLKVVYGDTDSVFVKLASGVELSLEDAEAIGSNIARIVTSSLEPPMELVFESFAKRAIFLAKKRYAIWVFEKSGGKWKDAIKVKGMETVRRDWCELASSTLTRVLEMILKKGDVDAATEHVRNTINRIKTLDLKQHPEVLNELIITRRYTKKTESYLNKQPHITVIEKIKQRSGSIPSVGDRIPYVITAGSGLLVMRAEDPDYVLANNVPIDTKYYIHKQILPPVERIFKSLGISTKHLSNSNLTINSENKSTQRSLLEF